MAILLPPLPKFVVGVNGLLRVDRPAQVSSVHLGMFTSEDRRIQVQATLKRLVAWRVLYHEQAHSWIDDCGIHFLSEKEEDAICQAVAAGRLAELLTQFGHRSGHAVEK